MNQLIHAYNPWVPLTHAVSADIRHPWLKNYKRHPVEFTSLALSGPGCCAKRTFVEAGALEIDRFPCANIPQSYTSRQLFHWLAPHAPRSLEMTIKAMP